MIVSKLVLVRHGESEWNLENRFTGWVDIPLSPRGIEEARRAGEKLKGMIFKKAFTSVLIRAQHTLEIILEVIGQKDIPVEMSVKLNERHYGDLQGLNKAETAKKYGDAQVKIWRRSYDVAPPGGESLKDTAARTLPYFKEKILPELQGQKNILVSAHGNSLRSIVMDLDCLSRGEVLELNISTGVPIVYEFSGQGAVVSKVILE